MSDYFKQDSNYQVSEVKRIKEMFETGASGPARVPARFARDRADRQHRYRGHHRISRRASAETPKRGGLVRMAGSQHGPDDTLDPLLWKETLGYTRGTGALQQPWCSSMTT